MSEEKLSEKFEEWNPMEKDYKNVKFNQYHTGPGADLDEDFQPGQQALKNDGGNYKNNTSKEAKNPTLVFKNIPNGMTKQAIFNICSRHGRVITVKDSKKCDYYFVELVTVADLEAVFRALEHNSYGFVVVVGRCNTDKTLSVLGDILGNQNIPPVSSKKTGIDYQNRRFFTSTKKLPRPKVQEECLVNGDENLLIDDKLPVNLLADDAHSLERQGLYKMQNKNNFNYRNGRSYINMPENTKEFIAKKRSESSGVYHQNEEKFVHSAEGVERPNNINKCSQCGRNCDIVCSRCSQYYCSVECQMNDWPQHRYICGKPKHLQKKPPSEIKKEPREIDDKSPKASNNTVTKKRVMPRSLQKTNINNSGFNSEKNLSTSSTNSLAKANNKKAFARDGEQYKQNMPPSGDIITITAITKTNVVFIRSKTPDANLSYFNTVDTLQAIGKNLKPLTNPPNCGSVVIAKFENQFNRALILNAKNLDNIVVNFMDYGNLDQMKMQDLYEAPLEFVNKPRHAIPVLLKDVPDLYMTQEIRNFMYTYLNNINVEIRYKPEDFRADNRVYAVELVDENTRQNLNKIIIKLATPKEPQNTDELCFRGYLEHKLLPSGDNIEFMVMDNSLMISGCISCTIKPYVIEIQKFQKGLQDYIKSIPEDPYTPRPEELCIARYSEDGLWYRGCCVEIVGDGNPSIHFIDYGNIDTVPIEDIRRYPPQFTFPIYTADCEIQGLPEFCGAQLVAKLRELIPNGKIIECATVKIFEEDHFYSIYLPSVINELNSCGLI